MPNIRGPRRCCGERRCVGFLLHKEFAGKLLHNSAFAIVLDEGVMLLGGPSGKGLEPVGVVAGAIVNGPFLHTVCNTVGKLQ